MKNGKKLLLSSNRNLSANNFIFMFANTIFFVIIISSAKVPVFKFPFLKQNREVRVGKFHDFSIDDVIFRAENAKERCSSTVSRQKTKRALSANKNAFLSEIKTKKNADRMVGVLVCSHL